LAAPQDADEVLAALRLGWYVAEVRGRNRPGGPVPPAESLPNRAGHVLPLRIERTPQELRIEAQSVVRKLAEDLKVDIYWALDPAAVCDPLTPNCWAFLLGAQRGSELTRLAGRLSGYFNPYCCPALAGTLRLWLSVAGDSAWRESAQDHLYRQTRRWYELLILGQDPSTLIKPYTIFRDWQASLRAVQALWVQLVTAAVSLLLVIALITLIINGSSNAFLKALFGVLGVAGLSAATVQAGLKNTAQSLFLRLRQDAYTDLVGAAIAVAPAKPGAERQDRVVAEEIRKRTLTTAADAAVP